MQGGIMEFSMVYTIFAGIGLCIILIAFMVITKTINTIGISLLRMEYLLKRELELVKERERIKADIMRQQRMEEDRRRKMEEESEGIGNIPSAVKKG
jgi:hypothetical protein